MGRTPIHGKDITVQHHPKTRFLPTWIAPETFVIHDHHGEGEAPVSVALNTMVIRAAEPVVIDTGMAENRDNYLSDVFSLVEPEDIRWLYISHDDVDHTGNLNALMQAAPNATVVVNWFMTERMGGSLGVPFTRQRWLGDGETLDVGDRKLHLVRPPIFDAPTTRGLFDPTTGVYWGSDSFATPMLEPTSTADDIDDELWRDGIPMFARYISPWLELVDEARFHRTVDRVQTLGATTLVGCHTPPVTGPRVTEVFDLLRAAPSAVVPPQPDQAVLDQITAALSPLAA
jgi:flavorubredoxin